MIVSPNYHGYSTDFEWDRQYFIPFITNYCLFYKFIPLTFAIVINWLIIFKSPSYSKTYRRSLAFYHITMIFYDVHHLILFVPYPLFPHPIFVCNGLLCALGGPPSLATTLTVAVAVMATITLFLLIFIRMRSIVPQESRFHLSIRQSVVIMGLTFFIMSLNVVGFAVFGGDSPKKTQILQRPEFAWLLNEPGAHVFGDIFDLGAFNMELDFLAFSVLYGVLFFPGILIYSAISLTREKKKLAHVKTRMKDQAFKMLMIQLFGAVFTFISPLFVCFASLRLGMPTSNPHVHSADHLQHSTASNKDAMSTGTFRKTYSSPKSKSECFHHFFKCFLETQLAIVTNFMIIRLFIYEKRELNRLMHETKHAFSKRD